MYQYSVDNTISLHKNPSAEISVARITALWAFSEAALGGILHALKIPFTGLFIGGAAVIFISLIAYFSENRSSIIKSTLIVIAVKAVVSPYTPVNAFLAVLIQGIIGYIIFFNKKNYKAKAIILAVTTSFLSGFQKILVLTIVFGNTLWESLDIFSGFILKKMSFSASTAESFSLSAVLISSYVFLHLAGGITFGVLAAKIPGWLKNKTFNNDELQKFNIIENREQKLRRKKRKSWWKKKSGLVIFLISLTMIIATYLFPELDKNIGTRILIMLVRSIFIMIVWTILISPIILKYFDKFIKNSKSKYSAEIEDVLLLFPYFKSYFRYIIKESKQYSGLTRFKFIFGNSFLTLLTNKIES